MSTVAIAGVGGVGGLAAERLIRPGVGRIKITDPGDYEESNLNRQFGSSMRNIGKKKIKAVFSQIKEINPQAQIFRSITGIQSKQDVDIFVDSCDFIIDAMDHGMFKQSILLQRAARKKGIHYLFTSAIGFGALAVVFDPKGLTLEEYNNLPLNVDLDNPQELKVPLEKIVPILPSYATDITVLNEIIAGERPVPTNSIGSGLAAILAASEAINVILGKNVPKAPKYTYLDLLDRRLIAGTIS